MQTIIFPVNDLARAKELFSVLLGSAPAYDSPYYVGFKLAGQDIGLDPNGHREGATAYWHVDDIQSRFAALIAAGAEEVEAVHDVGGGRLVASVKDADGNILGILQDPS
jgi:predicted enzyme related to lactoylglutathione lyase